MPDGARIFGGERYGSFFAGRGAGPLGFGVFLDIGSRRSGCGVLIAVWVMLFQCYRVREPCSSADHRGDDLRDQSMTLDSTGSGAGAH